MRKRDREHEIVCNGKSNPFQFNPLLNTTKITVAVVAVAAATAAATASMKSE